MGLGSKWGPSASPHPWQELLLGAPSAAAPRRSFVRNVD